jgi:hypothetical protein
LREQGKNYHMSAKRSQPDASPFLSKEQARAHLQLGHTTFYALQRRGIIPAPMEGRYDKNELDAAMENLSLHIDQWRSRRRARKS